MASGGKDDSEEDPGSQESLQLSFPLPPISYYKNYTDENVKNGAVLKPPDVVNGSYTMFGDAFDVSSVKTANSTFGSFLLVLSFIQ